MTPGQLKQVAVIIGVNQDWTQHVACSITGI